MSSTKLYLYTRFERFWHWAQATLIIILLVTGFEVHGTFTLFGFGSAVEIHNFCAWTWLVLYAFIVFWIITTGEWRHYVPTFVKMFEVIQYYVSGIFKGEPHPVPKSERVKHNPLQRITYLGIVSVLVPFQIITGFMYYLYNDWPTFGWAFDLSTIAILHTVGAFAMLVFFVVHVYMTTTGHHPFSHIKAMVTGYEELEAENK
ncbi:cytochrome b/b6 domain-containing protein [Halodesulfovibrio marinisediminis]|uniref:Thiosulfate reductase cytochrome b subunit n=1 Tax=Halodesulfovibrio marinisediminis DSM 17456 TaxID=1121457 RepID=A0A1N6E5J7_9BACT|nr:cytochrome b/b6 domain-containing protein [Halodesulfovibrio marinisediminis]SIN78243.1 Thiosulfate reductase cytochrome b subunit [Halodesulfovibrio marinisediminis DSM 17456]